jgi:glycerol-3-phosphate cytidylyltransferase
MNQDHNRWNMKVGFTCGAFDLLHAGHVLMLKEAREACDYLIVGVQSDPSVDRKEKNSPIQTHEERIIQVEGVKFVDEVVTYDTEDDLVTLLRRLNPDIRILGADHKGKKFTGWELPIDVFFNSRDHGYSTSELRDRIFREESKKHVDNDGKWPCCGNDVY